MKNSEEIKNELRLKREYEVKEKYQLDFVNKIKNPLYKFTKFTGVNLFMHSNSKYNSCNKRLEYSKELKEKKHKEEFEQQLSCINKIMNTNTETMNPSLKEIYKKLNIGINSSNSGLFNRRKYFKKLDTINKDEFNKLLTEKYNKDKEEEQKNRRNIERSEHNKNFKTEVNIKEQNLSSKNLNKSFEMPKDTNTQLMNKFLGQLNEAEKKISLLQHKNKELQFKLDEKQVEKEFSGYRTEDYNFSNYEEEFDLKKMVNGAREKNRSEDINIDYPGVQSVKDKYKELVQHLHLLEEQVKILICNINITSKIKPQINQICQLMRIRAENIQAIIAGKNKKKMLGLVV